MKKLLYPTIFVASFFCSGATRAAEKVNWHTDYKKALAEAQKTHKPIFINFRSDSCSPCLIFDRETASSPDFIRESRRWVMLKVDSQKNVEDARLAYKYQVAGFPTLVLTNSAGKALDSMTKIPSSSWKEWLAPKLSKAKEKFR